MILAIKGSGITDVEMPHEFRKVAFRCADKQVKVIGHQGISQQADVKDVHRPDQQTKEVFPVFRGAEDCPAFIPPAGNMIIRVGILDSQRSAHEATSALINLKSQE